MGRRGTSKHGTWPGRSSSSARGERLRLFLALELPPEVRAALGRLQPLESAPGAADYRWVQPELLHVTLAFLGSQSPDRLPLLHQVAESTARASARGTLSLGEPGSFGPPHAPRVLWVGLRGDLAVLTRLQSSLAAGLREAGFSLEDRPFSPHITLARRRPNARPGAQLEWPPRRRLSPLSVPVERLSLMQSELSPAGPRYTPLERYELA
jgi:2'-5' RNA ligase